METLEAIIYISLFIMMPSTFIIGFFINIKEENFMGLYMSLEDCQKYGKFKSYINLYGFYILNTWLFIIFIPGRLSNLLIKLTKIKKK